MHGKKNGKLCLTVTTHRCTARDKTSYTTFNIDTEPNSFTDTSA